MVDKKNEYIYVKFNDFTRLNNYHFMGQKISKPIRAISAGFVANCIYTCIISIIVQYISNGHLNQEIAARSDFLEDAMSNYYNVILFGPICEEITFGMVMHHEINDRLNVAMCLAIFISTLYVDITNPINIGVCALNICVTLNKYYKNRYFTENNALVKYSYAILFGMAHSVESTFVSYMYNCVQHSPSNLFYNFIGEHYGILWRSISHIMNNTIGTWLCS